MTVFRRGSASANTVRRKRGRNLLLLLALVMVLGGLATALVVPSLRWRVHLVALHAAGAIPDVGWADVLLFVKPGSAGYNNMARMTETRNPYAVISNPRTSISDVAAGAELFASRCSVCHGASGAGGTAAPALAGREFTHGASDWALYRTIRFGVRDTAMPAHSLSMPELWELVAYVRSLESLSQPGASPNTRSAAVNVSYDEIRAIREPTDDWLTFSGSYSSHRHSGLTQIGPSNVEQLSLRWIHQFEGPPEKIESSPLVKDGVMFLTLPNGMVMALDAASGERLWKFERKPPVGSAGGEFGVLLNRGVALLNDKVYAGTGDAHLIALEAKTGKLVWDVSIAPPQRYYVSSAPLAYRDLVVTGVGTKGGGRGVIAAFDAETGKERWRFTTIPDPGQFGHDTWASESWREGGAPTWMTGSYDPDRDLLIWGAGNPKPDYDTEVRKGDNLYSNTALALRGTTGERVWHFQFTPADDKDWDSNQVPILAELRGEQGPERRVLWANRNGFYYVLDRDSGTFLAARPFVHQTWAAGIDGNGRPKPLNEPARKAEGTLIYPGNGGATNWWPPAYDASRGLVFVPVLEQGMLFFPARQKFSAAFGQAFLHGYTGAQSSNRRTDLGIQRRGARRTGDVADRRASLDEKRLGLWRR